MKTRAQCLRDACSQDGTIQHEVKLTGEVSTTLASPADGTNPKHGEELCHAHSLLLAYALFGKMS